MKPILLLFLLAAGLSAAGDTVAVIAQPVANMYKSASADTEVVSQALYGANVTVLERGQAWVRIRTADEYTGWVPATSLRTGSAYPAAGRPAEIATLFAHIYREKDVTKHAPLLTLPFESRLEPVSKPAPGSRWMEVRLVDSRTAWVQTGDTVFDPKPLTIPEMLAFSRRFLGLPYTWGGTSSYGYDCSGFAQMLCRRRGVLLPRDAGPQAAFSGVTAIRRQDLQAGDLIYFGSSEQKITHTGIYLGGGQFIHATTNTTPVIQISDLNTPHWTRLFVAARRLKL